MSVGVLHDRNFVRKVGVVAGVVLRGHGISGRVLNSANYAFKKTGVKLAWWSLLLSSLKILLSC